MKVNLSMARGVKLPQTDLLAAISEPLGVKGNALVTFPIYDWTTEWHNFRNSSPTRKSKMAAAKPVTNIFQFINNIQHGISGSVTPRNEIPTATPTFSGSRNSMALLWIL